VRLAILALALLGAQAARATTWSSGDQGGANISLANGDILAGTYTNVGKLSLPAGATVFVSPGDTLSVYASTIEIYGTLDASGRGQPGGGGGPSGGNGTAGTAVSAGGGGNYGGAGTGGGGGAGFAAGGAGAGAIGTAGAASTGYGASISAPLSADDAWQGSGGGGGGGDNSLTGGGGAFGGGAVYLEASSVTVNGTINASGAAATSVTDGAVGTHPGGGGGGGGGTIVLRVTGSLSVGASAALSAGGGKGGNVDTAFGGTLEPGGGGGGGRVRIFTPAASYGGVTISTAAGAAGSKTTGFTGTVDTSNPPAAGSVGEVRFGTVPVSPSALAVQTLTSTSITYSWTATPQFGDGGNQTYRLFPSTSLAPYGNPDGTSTTSPATIGGLTPNTTYQRFLTAYSDWGDSAPSNSISTHTLADAPGAAATPFSSMADTSLKASWTSGSNGNPSYTTYEVDRSTDPAFGLAVSTSFVVGTSSSPSALLPNTSYYFRVRAINLDNVPTAFATTLTTATLATPPSSPALLHVYVTSVSFDWSQGANPADTKYEAQVSSDNFFSIAATSDTLASSATFFALTPGQQYYLRVFAYNREGVNTSYSTVISTTLGDTTNTTPPSEPGTPQPNVRFSYDGSVTFTWTPPGGAVGISGYNLIIGSTPGGNDLADIAPASLTTTQYVKTGLASGQTVYARVRAYSTAGVYGSFSSVSAGVPVFIATQASPFAKTINWPNPFNPSEGPTQIGIYVDSPADVKLRFFTLQGRLVHEQSYSFAAAGDQIVTWDGRNDSGARVAPGGYLVLVEKHYGGRSETQKLKIAVLY